MRILSIAALIACAACCSVRPACAWQPAAAADERSEGAAAAAPAGEPENSAHEELRALRRALLEAVSKSDFDALAPHLHTEVVVVWQNAEISRGREGVREYFRRMMEGPDRIVESVAIDATSRELTVLHGDDAGVAFGDAKARFVLRGRGSIDLDGPWSACLVRQDGRWLIAAFHASVNAFDNSLLAAAGSALYWVGGLAFVLGAALGGIVMVVARRRRT